MGPQRGRGASAVVIFLVVLGVKSINKSAIRGKPRNQTDEMPTGQKLTAQLTTEAPTIAVEQLGTALVPSSILASSSRNLYQSVFLKIDSHRSPHNSCPDRCGKEALKESSCWTKTRYTVSYYYVNSLDKDDCARFCLEAQDCEKVFFEVSKTVEIWNEDVKGTCRKVTNERKEEARSSIAQGLEATKSCLEAYIENLGCTSKDEDTHKVLVRAMELEHQRLMQTYYQKFKDIVQAYRFDPAKLRVKRDLDSFLDSIPIVSHLYGILKSPWENRKLKKHVKNLENRFLQFSSQVMNFTSQSRRFQNSVLEVFRSVQMKFNQLKCDLANVASALVHQSIIREHQEELNKLLVALSQGTLEANVGQILDLSEIKLIISASDQLNETIYSDHPELLFRVGNMVLMNFTNEGDHYNFHYVLVAPDLKKEAIYQIYEKVQVPITSNDKEDEQCMMVDIPQTLFKVGNDFVTVDISGCHKENAMILCVQDLTDPLGEGFQQVQCLNGNATACLMTSVPCQTTVKFTNGGALIFSQSQILGLPTEERTKLNLISSEDKKSYFFTWKDYSLIQTDRTVVHSIDDADRVISVQLWKQPEELVELQHQLSNWSQQFQMHDLKRLTEIVDETNQLVIDDIEPNFLGLGQDITKKLFLEYIAYISLAMTVLSLIIMLYIKCCRRRNTTLKATENLLSLFQDRRSIPNRGPRMRETPLVEEEFEVTCISPPRAVPEVNQEREELESNPDYESVYPPPNIRRALSYAYVPYAPIDHCYGKKRKRNEEDPCYDELFRKRTFSSPELQTLDLERNYFEPKFKAMYTQTTLKKPSRTVPPAPISLRNLSTRHFKDL